MRYFVYAMKDDKTGFATPTIDVNDEAAARNFLYALANNDFMKYAKSDFDLFRIGEFDSVSGVIVAESTPVFIVGGATYEA